VVICFFSDDSRILRKQEIEQVRSLPHHFIIELWLLDPVQRLTRRDPPSHFLDLVCFKKRKLNSENPYKDSTLDNLAGTLANWHYKNSYQTY
jgi:hypothetical protein